MNAHALEIELFDSETYEAVITNFQARRSSHKPRLLAEKIPKPALFRR